MAARQQPYQAGNRTAAGHNFNEQNAQFNSSPKAVWIQLDKGFDQKALDYCEELGRFLAVNELNTTQLRNVFGEMRRIQLKKSQSSALDGLYTQFLLLQPRVLYQAKRAGGKWEKAFTEQFQKLAILVRQGAFSTDYDRFMNIQEAILAYHKYYGGKDTP